MFVTYTIAYCIEMKEFNLSVLAKKKENKKLCTNLKTCILIRVSKVFLALKMPTSRFPFRS